MSRARLGAAAGAVLAATLLCSTPSAFAAQPAAATSAPFFCGHVSSSIDWLRVHRHIDSSDIVGQVAGGQKFCLTELDPSGDGNWAYGYGYNGSTKVTGWVVSRYIVD